MDALSFPNLLWSPSSPASTSTFRFRDVVNKKYGLSLKTYNDLYTWSVENISEFWSLIWDETNIVGDKGIHVINENATPADNPTWFSDAHLNWAENMLHLRSSHQTALVSAVEPTSMEPKSPIRKLSHNQLYHLVADLVSALLLVPVKPGDRIASYSSNCIENVVACLAATAIGAIWVSAAADFGPDGVIERFQQIKPTVIFSVDQVIYNGKTHPHLPKLSAVLDGLRTLSIIPSKVIIIHSIADDDRLGWDAAWVSWRDFLDQGAVDMLGRDPISGEILWYRNDFNWPLWILFSSGTTGLPKPIVHRAGGMLLQSKKEHSICSDIGPDDVCGWMMYNYLISALATGCTIVLYDGSPLHRKECLWNLVDELGVTIFGTSAKYLDSLSRVYRPREHHKLTSLKHIYSTGSPLPGNLYDYIYQHIHPDVLVGSITGGTDICSLFAGQNTALPVFRGEIQCRMLGMAVQAFSQDGKPVPPGDAGELVCTKPFPCQPLGFWPITGFDDDIAVQKALARYKQSYFAMFDNKVWFHGDHVIITPSKADNGGGLIMLGRSDGVLNPGGVRFGSSEIYDVLDHYFSETSPSISPKFVIHDALAVGQSINDGTDEQVILFVKLGDGFKLDHELVKALQVQLRAKRSARHVPEKVTDIPYTLNGKRLEVPIINGANLDTINLSTLRNPECLQEFIELRKKLKELNTKVALLTRQSLARASGFKLGAHVCDFEDSHGVRAGGGFTYKNRYRGQILSLEAPPLFTTKPRSNFTCFEMGHGTNESIYSRIATRARKVGAALPRMHLVFNAFRAITFVAILTWSLIVLAIAVHFQILLVSSDLTRFIPLSLFTSAFTIFVILSLLVLSTLRKINPVSTRSELLLVGLAATFWLALGLLTAISPSQNADVECFDDDGSLEVTSFNTDTFHAQYRVIEAFSLFNAILTWGYFLILLFLALRHHHLGWKAVWYTPATTSPLHRRPSQKPTRSGSLPAPVTARGAITEKPHRERSRHHSSSPRHGNGDRYTTTPRRHHHSSRRDTAPISSSKEPKLAGAKTYVVYVPDVTRPPDSHPRSHHRRYNTS
ncbi:hypothetical protein Clacol_001663 [Clathrus columnatus]|uniref:AMP-dependent synthetase/ligase domain-containing protein n=1 Tax=Clathrus columnatus TaxID=1419009 RepID=A0AAV5A4D7_9AGAM|nr:hypothetical protein Clacol_001663 [Clathrus columnatus]